MYEFKEEFRTGIEQIDEEHRKLFEITNRAYETMVNEFIPDKYDYIVEIINELKEYAATHFKHEEEYMMSIRYRRLISQKAEHEEFIEKISEFDLDEIDENQRKVILELLDFLGDWLVNHILKSDKLIGSQE
ncbi:MAG: hemerythrin family protein [Clostridiales bacterium]|jgi:hemerythrin|nr:hemerythrin family protein [Clostridiales bacterium]